MPLDKQRRHGASDRLLDTLELTKKYPVHSKPPLLSLYFFIQTTISAFDFDNCATGPSLYITPRSSLSRRFANVTGLKSEAAKRRLWMQGVT